MNGSLGILLFLRCLNSITRHCRVGRNAPFGSIQEVRPTSIESSTNSVLLCRKKNQSCRRPYIQRNDWLSAFTPLLPQLCIELPPIYSVYHALRCASSSTKWWTLLLIVCVIDLSNYMPAYSCTKSLMSSSRHGCVEGKKFISNVCRLLLKGFLQCANARITGLDGDEFSPSTVGIFSIASSFDARVWERLIYSFTWEKADWRYGFNRDSVFYREIWTFLIFCICSPQSILFQSVITLLMITDSNAYCSTPTRIPRRSGFHAIGKDFVAQFRIAIRKSFYYFGIASFLITPSNEGWGICWICISQFFRSFGCYQVRNPEDMREKMCRRRKNTPTFTPLSAISGMKLFWSSPTWAVSYPVLSRVYNSCFFPCCSVLLAKQSTFTVSQNGGFCWLVFFLRQISFRLLLGTNWSEEEYDQHKCQRFESKASEFEILASSFLILFAWKAPIGSW